MKFGFIASDGTYGARRVCGTTCWPLARSAACTAWNA
jgi:hypothetical protein